MRFAENVQNMKPTRRLFAARLGLGTFGSRVICCGFLWSLGGFGNLLLGFLAALRILGRILPKCANLDMSMRGKDDSSNGEDIHASWRPCSSSQGYPRGRSSCAL